MLQVRVRGRPGLRTPRVRRNLALPAGRAGEGEKERSNPWRLAAGSPPGSVVGSGSHRGVAASQPPVRPGSPDIGEQKLSVPVATVAPAAAKFRGGGRRAAESPPPPPHPAALAAPPPRSVVRKGPSPSRKTPELEEEWPSLPCGEGGAALGEPPPLGPAHQLQKLDGGVCLPGYQSSGRPPRVLRTLPPGRCMGRGPEGPEWGVPARVSAWARPRSECLGGEGE